jgi:hypothetical protein
MSKYKKEEQLSANIDWIMVLLYLGTDNLWLDNNIFGCIPRGKPKYFQFIK